MPCRNRTEEFNRFLNPPEAQPIQAYCLLSNVESQPVGRVDFIEIPNEWLTKIDITVWNQCPGLHGIHVHEGHAIDNTSNNFCPGRKADQPKITKQDLFNQCCKALGGHFNDDSQSVHGSPEDDYTRRHIGDLGNISVSRDGQGFKTLYDRLIMLRGRWNVINRSIVLHQNSDDLGRGQNSESIKNGGSGDPVAFGLIQRIN